MSTTAARIPAFRQCILPAGWDMARPPRVSGRALALPPRAPAGPAPRAPRCLLPALAPAPRPPAARHAWAPPRLGAPRGSGDWALTSRRPSASPQGPRDGRRPLPKRGHFQGSLGARPGRTARGLRFRRAARAGTPPWPCLPCPAPGARAAGGLAAPPPAGGSGPLALGAARGSAPAFALRSAPGLPPFSRLSLAVPSSALPVPRPPPPLAGPRLPPWAKAADALSQPGPPGYFSDAVTVFKTGRKNMHREETRVLSPSETAFARGHRRGPPHPRPRLRGCERRQAPALSRPRLPSVLTQPDATSPLFPSPRKDSGAGWGSLSSMGAYGDWGQFPG